MTRKLVALAFAALSIAGGVIKDEARLTDLRWTGGKDLVLRGPAATGRGREVDVRVTTRTDPIRYKNRLAFYRLAVALGSHVVPLTELRAMPLAELLAALGKDPSGQAVARRDMAVLNDGTVIVLISDALGAGREVELDNGAEARTWRAWAEGRASIPEERQRMASDYVETLMLDYLSGNPTRTTVVIGAANASIHLVDNGDAFPERLEPGALDGLLARLRRVTRFPRGFTRNLRSFDRATADAALHSGTFATWLLHVRSLSELFERKEALLSLVEARRAELGDEVAMALP